MCRLSFSLAGHGAAGERTGRGKLLRCYGPKKQKAGRSSFVWSVFGRVVAALVALTLGTRLDLSTTVLSYSTFHIPGLSRMAILLWRHRIRVKKSNQQNYGCRIMPTISDSRMGAPITPRKPEMK